MWTCYPESGRSKYVLLLPKVTVPRGAADIIGSASDDGTRSEEMIPMSR